MTIESDGQLHKLRIVGRLVARTLAAMGKALEPGMTTKGVDDLGRALLERERACSAPELTYGFPGATCISVGPNCAHGIPDGTVVKAGDLINIDVSAELDGYFGDTGASSAVPPSHRTTLSRWSSSDVVRNQSREPGNRLNEVGRTIQSFARRNGHSIVRNLASNGVGRSLRDEPAKIPTWYEPRDTRTIPEGLVFTIESLLSLGADWVEGPSDGWSHNPPYHQLTVQYEHTLVATSRGPLILNFRLIRPLQGP